MRGLTFLQYASLIQLRMREQQQQQPSREETAVAINPEAGTATFTVGGEPPQRPAHIAVDIHAAEDGADRGPTLARPAARRPPVEEEQRQDQRPAEARIDLGNPFADAPSDHYEDVSEAESFNAEVARRHRRRHRRARPLHRGPREGSARARATSASSSSQSLVERYHLKTWAVVLGCLFLGSSVVGLTVTLNADGEVALELVGPRQVSEIFFNSFSLATNALIFLQPVTTSTALPLQTAPSTSASTTTTAATTTARTTTVTTTRTTPTTSRTEPTSPAALASPSVELEQEARMWRSGVMDRLSALEGVREETLGGENKALRGRLSNVEDRLGDHAEARHLAVYAGQQRDGQLARLKEQVSDLNQADADLEQQMEQDRAALGDRIELLEHAQRGASGDSQVVASELALHLKRQEQEVYYYYYNLKRGQLSLTLSFPRRPCLICGATM